MIPLARIKKLLRNPKTSGKMEALLERWAGSRVRIYSKEHGMYWRGVSGYTYQQSEAWVITFMEAFLAVAHCDESKGIQFEMLPSVHYITINISLNAGGTITRTLPTITVKVPGCIECDFKGRRRDEGAYCSLDGNNGHLELQVDEIEQRGDTDNPERAELCPLKQNKYLFEI